MPSSLCMSWRTHTHPKQRTFILTNSQQQRLKCYKIKMELNWIKLNGKITITHSTFARAQHVFCLCIVGEVCTMYIQVCWKSASNRYGSTTWSNDNQQVEHFRLLTFVSGGGKYTFSNQLNLKFPIACRMWNLHRQLIVFFSFIITTVPFSIR